MRVWTRLLIAGVMLCGVPGSPAAQTPDQAKAVEWYQKPRSLELASGAIVNFAYLEGPAGAKVELVQR